MRILKSEKGVFAFTSLIPLLTIPLSSPIHTLQYGVAPQKVSICVATSAALVTKTKTIFPSWLTSKVLLLAVVDKTKKRKGTKRREVRKVNAWLLRLLRQRSGTWGEGAGDKNISCAWTPPHPSGVVLSTNCNVLAENKNWKLISIFNFQFLAFRRKQRN